MKVLIPQLLLLYFIVVSCAPLKKLADLPLLLKENSGLIYQDSMIWVHNDSGDEPYLYQLNLDGTLVRKILIQGAKNIDWEDITQDKKQNIYIGDFGNNNNSRQDLCIYKIPGIDLTKDTILAEKIEFHYPEQTSFPPPPANRYFDAEAMVIINDSIYIFTKNRTQPNDGLTKCYQIPIYPGKYVAKLVSSFEVKPHGFLYSITAAACSPDGSKLALLSMTKVYIFSNQLNNQPFSFKFKKTYKLPFTQKEAIDFIDNRTILLSDEKSPFGKPHLYRLKLH